MNNNKHNIIIIKTGFDPDAVPEHKEYLETMCVDFEQKLKAMIQDGIAERKQQLDTGDSLYSEILQHTVFCQTKCRLFRGREDVLQVCKICTSRCTCIIHDIFAH